jgi:hypothetical protein
VKLNSSTPTKSFGSYIFPQSKVKESKKESIIFSAVSNPIARASSSFNSPSSPPYNPVK